MDYMVWVWLGAIVLFSLLEAISPQLISIWFVFGALVALIVSLFGVPLWIQFTIFIVLSLAVLAVSRPFLKKYVLTKKVSTNADRYIGQNAIVTTEINNTLGAGQVSVSGSVWTARSTEEDTVIEVGKMVLVERIEGVKLIVSPLK